MKTALLIAALLAAPVAAQAADAVPTTTVRFNDLDLTTAEGIARLDARIESAARSMCFSGGRDIQALRYEADCRSDVIESNRSAVRLAIARANEEKVRMAAADKHNPDA